MKLQGRRSPRTGEGASPVTGDDLDRVSSSTLLGPEEPPVDGHSAEDPALPAYAPALVSLIADVLLDRLRRAAVDLTAPPAAGREWLTVDEAARYLGMTRKALYAAVERRQVPASRLGVRLRFSRAGLDHLLSRRQARTLQRSSRVPSPRET